MMKTAPVPGRLPITSCSLCRQSFRPQRPEQARRLICEGTPEATRRGPGVQKGDKHPHAGARKLWVYPERTPKGKRICRRCGGDPKPNMFYCPACHDVVSDYVDDQFAVL